MNAYAAQQAQQAALFHAHPAMWAFFPLLFVVVVISIIILVRWLMSLALSSGRLVGFPA